jgi:pimeloyl-ACP methyl ester carboxylesterase
MNFIETRDGTRLYVKDWGEGRPIILIHGWPLSADSWDEVAIPIVEKGYRVIAYDRRGFGRSEQPYSGYNYDTFSDDLADVMKATNAQNATLVGFSMGGGEVARYMSRHKGKNVAQAVLISSIVPYMLKTDDNPHGVPQETFDEMTKGMKKDRAHFFSGFFKDFYGVGMLSHPVSDELLEWSRNVSMSASLKATLDSAKAFATTDFRPDLSSFNVPTLIIHGTSDKTVPIDATAKEAVKGIADATLLKYDGEPHGLFATKREQLTGDLISFFETIRNTTVPIDGNGAAVRSKY